MANEIWIVPFIGQGHLFPLMELCKHLASRNFKAVLVISSNLTSSVPSSLRQYPLVEIAEINEMPSPSPPPPEAGAHPFHHHQEHHSQMAIGLEKLLSIRDPIRPVCAVLDMMMNWTSDFFKKFEIPAVSFFTSGACSAAMEYAMWKAHPLDVKPGETHVLPGLPEEMAITVSDIKRQSRRPLPFPMGGSGPPGGPDERAPPLGPPRGRGKFGPQRPGPPNPGDQPPWLHEIELSIGVMINTCDELEHPFIEYLASRIEKPVWGVGPLLPDQYWKSAGSVVRDGEIRSNRKSNITEDKVNEWLDAKPRGSVLYVSFGSEVGPTKEEYAVLAEALEASTRPFIWVVQANAGKPGGPPRPAGPPGSESEEAYFPHGLDGRVGKRGLIIHGWAPQLMILSHPSTGGFLSHCGWNSTVEANGRGVPFLACPIRGDQFTDAKMVVSYLKVVYLISEDFSEAIKKDEISKGIEVLLGDEEMKQRAVIKQESLQSLSAPQRSSETVSNFLSIKLDMTNYPLWLAQIKPLLKSKNLMGYVEGTKGCPPAFKSDASGKLTDQINEEYEQWIAQDQMILGWLNNSLTPAVLATVARSTNSHFTWSSLAKRFASSSQNRILQLRGELLRTMRGNLSISDFLDKINSIADNLALAGSPMEDADLVSIIMNNVGPQYEYTVASAQARDTPITYDSLEALLISAERRFTEQQQSALDISSLSTALHATHLSSRGRGRGNSAGRGSFTPRNNFNAGGRGLSQRGRGGSVLGPPPSSSNSQFLGGGSSQRPTCQICNRVGHIVLDCYNRMNTAYEGRVDTFNCGLTN